LYTGDYKEDGTPVRQIGPDDRQIIELDPDFLGGFNTRVAYKDFDLSVIGSFQRGGILLSTLVQGYKLSEYDDWTQE
jgi:TonB-dependent starch-binding outer membrane protein SusC